MSEMQSLIKLARSKVPLSGYSGRDVLIKLARTPVPFGQYAGFVVIDLPEDYLFYLQDKGFPAGELGRLMDLALLLKVERLDSLVKPLKL